MVIKAVAVLAGETVRGVVNFEQTVEIKLKKINFYYFILFNLY